MNKIDSLLKPSNNKVKLSFKILSTYIFYNFIISYFYYGFLQNMDFIRDKTPLTKIDIFETLFFAPITEEIIYRWAPILIAAIISKKTILPIIVLSSYIFGWEHGNGIEGVLFQGVFGFLLSYLYIKCNLNLLYPIIVHFCWNLICLLVLDNYTYIL